VTVQESSAGSKISQLASGSSVTPTMSTRPSSRRTASPDSWTLLVGSTMAHVSVLGSKTSGVPLAPPTTRIRPSSRTTVACCARSEFME